MVNLSDINRQWREFPMTRSRAQRDLQRELDELREKIDGLRGQVQERESAFDEEWRRRKDALYEERNEAIKEAAREGRSGAEILREMGGNNTQLVYKLIQEAMTEQADGHVAVKVKQAEEAEPEPDTELEGVEWQSHPHTGVHRWLLSSDGLFYKRYSPDAASPEDEDAEWYVAMADGNGYVAGSRDLWQSTPADEAERRVGMLRQLLTGEYQGRIRLGANMFTH
jgi:transposase-like protein